MNDLINPEEKVLPDRKDTTFNVSMVIRRRHLNTKCNNILTLTYIKSFCD